MKPQRRALGGWAIDSLYEQIFTGELKAGADLGEELICQKLEVSRATIGVALRQLEQEGLATVAAGNGRRQVAAFTLDDVADLYDVRVAIEGFAVGRAARFITPEALETLESLQDEMERISRRPDRPSKRDFGVDFEFHQVITRESGSKRSLASLHAIWNQSHALLRHLYSVGAYADSAEDTASYQDHRKIIAALRDHDPEKATQAMVAHLTGRRDQLIASIKARGGIA